MEPTPKTCERLAESSNPPVHGMANVRKSVLSDYNQTCIDWSSPDNKSITDTYELLIFIEIGAANSSRISRAIRRAQFITCAVERCIDPVLRRPGACDR